MVKKKTTKKTAVKKAPVAVVETEKKTSKDESSKTVKILAVFLGTVLLIVVVGYLVRSRMVAAFVNGVAIGRMDIVGQLEKTQGKQILESLIVKELITQEAKKQNIQVSDTEVEAELSKIKEQLASRGQDFNVILNQQGMTLADVQKEIRLQKLLEKLLTDKSTITDEEITSFLEQNKEYLPESTDEAGLKEQAREQLKSQKLSTEAQALIQELKQKASINYFGIYNSASVTDVPLAPQE